ncbi:MAG: hypothetical protein J5601_02430 [Elusimicrobiaceae bacterium]|nr:hypothetical protein [Elusimicrobiaceae bacterium]
MKKVIAFLMVLCMVSPVFAQRAHQTPKKTPKDVEQNLNESLRKRQQSQRALITAVRNNYLSLAESILDEYPELANAPMLVSVKYYEEEFNVKREVPLMCFLVSTDRAEMVELFISKGFKSNFTCPASEAPDYIGEISYKDGVYYVPLPTLVMIRWDVLKVLEASKNAKVKQWLKNTGISDVSGLERSRKETEVSVRRQFGENQKMADWALSLGGEQVFAFPWGATIECHLWKGHQKWEEKRPLIVINEHGNSGKKGYYFYGYDKKLLKKVIPDYESASCMITSRRNKRRQREVRPPYRGGGCS